MKSVRKLAFGLAILCILVFIINIFIGYKSKNNYLYDNPLINITYCYDMCSSQILTYKVYKNKTMKIYSTELYPNAIVIWERPEKYDQFSNLFLGVEKIDFTNIDTFKLSDDEYKEIVELKDNIKNNITGSEKYDGRVQILCYLDGRLYPLNESVNYYDDFLLLRVKLLNYSNSFPDLYKESLEKDKSIFKCYCYNMKLLPEIKTNIPLIAEILKKHNNSHIYKTNLNGMSSIYKTDELNALKLFMNDFNLSEISLRTTKDANGELIINLYYSENDTDLHNDSGIGIHINGDYSEYWSICNYSKIPLESYR